MAQRTGIRSLSSRGISHADPNSKIHAEDKRLQAERRKVTFLAIPTPDLAAEFETGKAIDKAFVDPVESFGYEDGGWMGFYGNPIYSDMMAKEGLSPQPPQKAESRLVKDWLNSVNTRQQIRIKGKRKGKEEAQTRSIHTVKVKVGGKWTTQKQKPVMAIMTTMAPWHTKTFRRHLDDAKFDALWLDFFDRAGQLLHKQTLHADEVDGKPTSVQMLSVWRHRDTAHDHGEISFSVVDPLRRYTKPNTYLPSTGPWVLGADRQARIGMNFTGKTAEWWKNATRPDGPVDKPGLPLQLNRLLDQVCEEHARKHKLTQLVEANIAAYKKHTEISVTVELLKKSIAYGEAAKLMGVPAVSPGLRVLRAALKAQTLKLGAVGLIGGVVGAVGVEVAKKGIKHLRKESEERRARVEKLLEKNKMLDDPTPPGSL